MARVMKANGDEPEENNHTNDGIGNGEPWRNQRTKNVSSNLGPVKRDRNQRETGPAAKELVQNNVIGSNECDESEDAQEWSNVARNPVPDK